MKNIINTLEILTGRRLSEADMQRAETGKKVHLPDGFCEGDHVTSFPRHETNIFKEGDKIILNKVKYSGATETPDFSYPKHKHTGNYWVKSAVKTYNNGGLLEKVEIQTCLPCGPSTGQKTFTYSPAGSFRWNKKEIVRV